MTSMLMYRYLAQPVCETIMAHDALAKSSLDETKPAELVLRTTPRPPEFASWVVQLRLSTKLLHLTTDSRMFRYTAAAGDPEMTEQLWKGQAISSGKLL